jgi:hypothetical protein
MEPRICSWLAPIACAISTQIVTTGAAADAMATTVFAPLAPPPPFLALRSPVGRGSEEDENTPSSTSAATAAATPATDVAA